MKRRTFIQTSGLALAGLSALPTMAFDSKFPVGLQLYTLRDIISKDPKGVLKMVTDLGYRDFETFGYNDGKLFGMPAKEFSAYVKSLGGRIVSGHYGLGKSENAKDRKGTLLNGWEAAVADAKEMGQEYMALAYLNADERKTLDDYKWTCEKINQSGEVCKKYGIRMGYHNHDFEFVPIDGQKPYDLMLSLLDPKLVSMELDLYWATFSNQNPIEYFKKYPGRFEQWHVKDMDKNDRKRNADIGTGAVDFKSLFVHAAEAGLKHYYMEQETYPISSTESVKASISFLKSL